MQWNTKVEDPPKFYHNPKYPTLMNLKTTVHLIAKLVSGCSFPNLETHFTIGHDYSSSLYASGKYIKGI